MKKPILKTIVIVIMLLTGMAATLPAQVTRYVREINPAAESPFTTWDTAATNIADAVNAANANNAGDTVLISNGVYHLTSQVTIQNTIVKGAAGDRTTVVVDSGNNGRCFSLTHAGAALADLTVSGGGLTISSGIISNCVITKNISTYRGGGAYLTSGLVTDCLITSNTAPSGGGVYQAGGLITDCLVTSNLSTSASGGLGGGVYLTGAGSVLRDSVIADNVAKYGGGGVRAEANSLVTNCMISGNSTTLKSSNWGGGGVDLVGPVQIANCVISNNWVPNSLGAGIRFSDNATASWCTVVCNTNASSGGGIHLYDGTNVVEYCTITSNVCNKHGGGIFVRSRNHLIRGCVIRGNTAGSYAGGIYLPAASSVTVSNCFVADNWAVYAGGIYAGVSPDVLITHSTISNNTHGGSLYGGGGMWISDGGMIRDCVICDNQTTNPASYGAGGIYLRDMGRLDNGVNTTVFRNCLFTGNSAMNGNGGGLYVYKNPNTLVQNCTIASNSGYIGGGFYCSGSGAMMENTILYGNSASTANPNWRAGSTTFTNCCASPVDAKFNAASTDQAPGYDAHYRLLPGSPCINTGVNRDWMEEARDLDGHPRLDAFTGQVDMGCYEYVYQGTILLVR